MVQKLRDNEIIVLDRLDEKIIAELNRDVRGTYSSIARSVRSSKEVVAYRVNRLVKQGVIKEFVTIFMRYWSYKVLMRFGGMTPEKEREFVNFLVEIPQTNWVTPCSGGYDLVFAIKAKDPQEFDGVLRKVCAKLGPQLLEYKVAVSLGSDIFGPTFASRVRRAPALKRDMESKTDVDSKDRSIARVLLHDARASLMEIYQQTRIPPDTVKYRIKRMESLGLIRRYRMVVDSARLGFFRYEVFIKCNDLPDRVVVAFKEFAKNHPSVEFCSQCVGAWNMEMTVNLRNALEFRSFVQHLKNEFKSNVHAIETVNLFETYKFTNLPPELSE